MTPMQPGQTIAGKYRIERVLGEGGMGVVFEATHLQLDQRVAIKVLHGEALQSEEAVGRFAREAKAAAKIQSEHVVKVFDVSTLEGGAPFLVMEYLEGRDLDGQLRQSGPLTIDDAVTYVLQACEALAEAHKNGIVHRDLKPANLFVSERSDGSMGVKILDFGISKLAPKGPNEVSVTRTSALMGSPLYMAPEQMRSTRNVDSRADIWSLGIILYELLAGGPPFDGETLTEVCAAIVADQPRSLIERRSMVPPELEAIIFRCLEKDATKRFQDVLELAITLQPFAPEQGTLSVKRITRVLRKGEPGAPASSVSQSAMAAVRVSPVASTSSPALSAPPAMSNSAVISQPQLQVQLAPTGQSGYQGPAISSTDAAATAAAFGRTGPDLTKSPRPPLLLFGAIGGGVLLVGGIVALALMSKSEPKAAVQPAASSAPSTPVIVAPPQPTTTSEPKPAASAEVTPPPSAKPAASTTAKPNAPTSTRPPAVVASAKPTSTPKPAGSAAPASTQGFGGRE